MKLGGSNSSVASIPGLPWQDAIRAAKIGASPIHILLWKEVNRRMSLRSNLRIWSWRRSLLTQDFLFTYCAGAV
jgi:hypothetical protein